MKDDIQLGYLVETLRLKKTLRTPNKEERKGEQMERKNVSEDNPLKQTAAAMLPFVQI